MVSKFGLKPFTEGILRHSGFFKERRDNRTINMMGIKKWEAQDTPPPSFKPLFLAINWTQWFSYTKQGRLCVTDLYEGKGLVASLKAAGQWKQAW